MLKRYLESGQKKDAPATEFQSKVKNKVLHAQSREVIANVLKFMQQEAMLDKPSIPFCKVHERVCKAVGVSRRTISNIANEMNLIDTGESSSFVTPNLKRTKRATVTNLDDFNRSILRTIIINLYVTDRKVPTLRNVHKKYIEDTGYKGSRESFRVSLRQVGFRWGKTKTHKKLLMERHDIRSSRLQFLRNIKQYREENRPIIYMDQTYINLKYINKNCTEKPNSKNNHSLFIQHAGGESGFVKDAYLKFNSINKSEEYNREIYFENFKKWLQEKLIPNLPPKSILVLIDNASYYKNALAEKRPSPNSTKENMKKWLKQKNIHFHENMLKPELYNIIKLNKPRHKTYEIDSLLQHEGHDVLRLPPHHPDLNPIELVWASLKEHIGQRNVNAENVDRLCEEFFDHFSVDDWKLRCEHAKKSELFFMEKEPALDLVLDELGIDLGASQSDTESSSDSEDDQPGYHFLH